MTKTIFATSAAAILLATTALAGPIDDLVAQMEAEGYTQIEVETENGETEVEGVLNNMEREVTFDADGNVIKDETSPVDEEDDEDDSESEDDDDDSDDQDDEDEDGEEDDD